MMGKLYNKEMLTKLATAIYENNQNGRVVQTINNLKLSIKQLTKKVEKIVNLFISASDNDDLLNQLKEKHKTFMQEKKDYEKELIKYKLLNETNSNKSVNEIYGIAKITSGSLFYTALTKITAIMNTGWSMMVIVVIAVLAGLIIYYIRGGFGGTGGAGGGY